MSLPCPVRGLIPRLHGASPQPLSFLLAFDSATHAHLNLHNGSLPIMYVSCLYIWVADAAAENQAAMKIDATIKVQNSITAVLSTYSAPQFPIRPFHHFPQPFFHTVTTLHKLLNPTILLRNITLLLISNFQPYPLIFRTGNSLVSHTRTHKEGKERKEERSKVETPYTSYHQIYVISTRFSPAVMLDMFCCIM